MYRLCFAFTFRLVVDGRDLFLRRRLEDVDLRLPLGLERQSAKPHVQQVDGTVGLDARFPHRPSPAALQGFRALHAGVRTIIHISNFLFGGALACSFGRTGLSQRHKSVHEDLILESSSLLCSLCGLEQIP